MPKAQLTLRLPDGSDYTVLKRTEGYQVIAHRAGGSYTVTRTAAGMQCTCPDFIHRAQSEGRLCKHGQALLDAVHFPELTTSAEIPRDPDVSVDGRIPPDHPTSRE